SSPSPRHNANTPRRRHGEKWNKPLPTTARASRTAAPASSFASFHLRIVEDPFFPNTLGRSMAIHGARIARLTPEFGTHTPGIILRGNAASKTRLRTASPAVLSG